MSEVSEVTRYRMKTGSLRPVNAPMIVGKDEIHWKPDGTQKWRQGLVRVVLGHVDVMLRSRECIDAVARSGGDSS